MGFGQSKNQHLQHYYKPDENKLWIFDPNDERFYCFPCFFENKPFFFLDLQSISVAQDNMIYFIGGKYAKSKDGYKYDNSIRALADMEKDVHWFYPSNSKKKKLEVPKFCEKNLF